MYHISSGLGLPRALSAVEDPQHRIITVRFVYTLDNKSECMPLSSCTSCMSLSEACAQYSWTGY